MERKNSGHQAQYQKFVHNLKLKVRKNYTLSAKTDLLEYDQKSDSASYDSKDYA